MAPVSEGKIRADGTFAATIPNLPADGDGDIELYFSWSDNALGEMNSSATVRKEDLSEGVSLGDLLPPDVGGSGPNVDSNPSTPEEGDVVEDLTADTTADPEVVEPGETGDVTYPDLEVAPPPVGGNLPMQDCRLMHGTLEWHYIKPYGSASNTSRNVYVPVQRIRTEARTTSSYAFEHTKGTKTSQFFQAGSKFAAGGLSTALVKSSSYGSSVNIGAGKSRIIKAKWNYRKFKQMCRTSSPLWVLYWEMSGRAWLPQKGYPGQVSFAYWGRPFPCYQGNKRYFTSSSIWVARSTGFYFSGSFTVAGTLGASREKNETNVSTKTFTRRSGYYGFTLCGQNDPEPGRASDMKEVNPSS